MGFLPLASGAGIFLLLGDVSKVGSEARTFLAPIGVFGALITAGLYAFELHGIAKCTALIERGEKLELDLGVTGQFETLPKHTLVFLNEPFASGVIYSAVLAAWTFLALVFSCSRERAWQAAGLVFFVGFLLPIGFWWPENWWPREEKKPEKQG